LKETEKKNRPNPAKRSIFVFKCSNFIFYKVFFSLFTRPLRF